MISLIAEFYYKGVKVNSMSLILVFPFTHLSSPLSNLGPVDGSQMSDKEPAHLVVS